MALSDDTRDDPRDDARDAPGAPPDPGPEALARRSSDGPEASPSPEVAETVASTADAPSDVESTLAATTDTAPPSAQHTFTSVPPAPRSPTPLRDDAVAVALANPWGSALRSMTLGALLSVALLVWTQLTFKARWVVTHLTDNDLDLGSRRLLIRAMLIAGVVGAAVVGAVLAWRWRKGRDRQVVERWLWWLSPLIALPFFPTLFRYRAWKDRAEFLLPAALLGALVMEVLATRAFASVPAQVSRVVEWLRARPGPRLSAVGRRLPLVVVCLASAGYIVFFAFYTLRWHYKIQTHLFDLGINTQLLWASLHGKHMYSTLVFPDAPEKYIANHAKFGQYFLWPFFAIWPRAETLLIAQATMLGAGALPLYAFARRHVSDWVAAALAIAWVCYYPMQSANFYETNYIMSGSFWVLSAIWAADSKRWLIFAFTFFWALISREDMPIGLAVAGTVLALSGHRPKLGLVMAVVSTAWFGFLRFYWMDKAGEWWFPDMYKGLYAPGETGFKSVIKTLVTNPLFVLGKIVEKDKLYYLLHLLVPLAFVPLRRWWALAAVVPGTILTLLATNNKPLTMHTFQYVMHWAPYLFLATPLVLAAIRRELGAASMRGTLAGLAFATAVMTYNLGAFSRRPDTFRGGYFLINFEYTEADAERYRNLQEILKSVPPDARLAATENTGAHVAARLVIYTMRNGPRNADWALASARELGLERTKPRLKEVLEKGEFGVVRRVADFALFKRGHDTSGNAQLMRDWGL